MSDGIKVFMSEVANSLRPTRYIQERVGGRYARSDIQDKYKNVSEVATHAPTYKIHTRTCRRSLRSLRPTRLINSFQFQYCIKFFFYTFVFCIRGINCFGFVSIKFYFTDSCGKTSTEIPVTEIILH